MEQGGHGSGNVVMEHRERDKNRYREEGMWLMGQREGRSEGNKELGKRLWGIGKGVERGAEMGGCSYEA